MGDTYFTRFYLARRVRSTESRELCGVPSESVATMGVFTSRLSAFSSTMMMNTDMNLHFQQDLIDQWETARATGAMQTIAQFQAASGPGGASASAFGSGYTTWIKMGGIIRRFAPTVIPIAGILAGLTFAFKWSQGLMMLATSIGIFFLLYFLSYLSLQRINISDGTTFWVALFSSLVTSFIISFVLYDPAPDAVDSSKQQIVVVTPANTQDRRSFL